MKIQKLKQKANKGFTIIELMIGIVILGVLTAIAYPSYQDYTIRAQAAEGLSLMSGAKLAVAEHYALNGNTTMSDDTNYASGKYVSSIAIEEDGRIIATYGGEVNEKLKGVKLILKPDGDGGNLKWSCLYGNKDLKKYFPSSCTVFITD